MIIHNKTYILILQSKIVNTSKNTMCVCVNTSAGLFFFLLYFLVNDWVYKVETATFAWLVGVELTTVWSVTQEITN